MLQKAKDLEQRVKVERQNVLKRFQAEKQRCNESLARLRQLEGKAQRMRKEVVAYLQKIQMNVSKTMLQFYRHRNIFLQLVRGLIVRCSLGKNCRQQEVSSALRSR